MMRTLLRLPSPAWETELATEIHAIDDYLKRLDANLVGAKWVRRPTLLEARDFLLEAFERALPDTRSQAITEAERIFGDPPVIGHSQRTERSQVFRKSLWQFSLGLGLIFLIAELLTGARGIERWLELFALALLQGIFLGGLAAFWSAYWLASSLPDSDLQAADSASFVAINPRRSRYAAALFVAGFASMSILHAIGFIGLGPMADSTKALHVFHTFIFAYLSLFVVAHLFLRIRVSSSLIEIIQWNRRRVLKPKMITGFSEAPPWSALVVLAASTVYRLTWRDEDGSDQRIDLPLSKDLVNGERLRAFLENAAATHSGPAQGT